MDSAEQWTVVAQLSHSADVDVLYVNLALQYLTALKQLGPLVNYQKERQLFTIAFSGIEANYERDALIEAAETMEDLQKKPELSWLQLGRIAVHKNSDLIAADPGALILSLTDKLAAKRTSRVDES